MERENLHYSIEKKRSWLLYDVHANKKLFTSNYTLLHTTCKFGLTYLFLSPITTEIFRWLLLVTSPYIRMYLAVSIFFYRNSYSGRKNLHKIQRFTKMYILRSIKRFPRTMTFLSHSLNRGQFHTMKIVASFPNDVPPWRNVSRSVENRSKYFFYAKPI